MQPETAARNNLAQIGTRLAIVFLDIVGVPTRYVKIAVRPKRAIARLPQLGLDGQEVVEVAERGVAFRRGGIADGHSRVVVKDGRHSHDGCAASGSGDQSERFVCLTGNVAVD